MAVDNTGVPLFAGAADADQLFLATMEELEKDVQNIIDVHDPVWRYLERNNLIEKRADISQYVPVKLMDKENSTVKDFTHYDDVDNTPQEALSEAKFAYGHTVGTQMYSREELVKNSGPSQLIDLVKTKKDQLETSMTNHISSKLKGAQDADGRSMMGMRRIMAYNQTCGGIDPTVAGFAYWNPQRMLKGDNVTAYSLATEMREGMRRLDRLCSYQGFSPDVVIAGEDVYDAQQAWAEEKLRMSVDDLREKQGWGAHQMFTHNGKTWIYDPDLNAKTVEMWNFQYVKVRVHSGTNFQMQPWQMMESKVAKKRDCLTYMSVYCKQRNRHGFGTFT